jgi:hypothetical protein
MVGGMSSRAAATYGTSMNSVGWNKLKEWCVQARTLRLLSLWSTKAAMNGNALFVDGSYLMIFKNA